MTLPVLAITREEYANLFHTLHDVFNAYHTMMMMGLIREFSAASQLKGKVQILFLDGHAEGALDEIWSNLFGPPIYLSSFRNKSQVCFRRIVFVHPGSRWVEKLFSKPRLLN